MANLGNQTITITLFGDPVTGSPTHVQSYLYVPSHVHQLNDLAGLTEDVLPQYMTEARAADLFLDLSNQLIDATTASNLGSGNGLFVSKIDDVLRFKSLIAGTNITFVDDGESITISSAGGTGGGSADTVTYSPTVPGDWVLPIPTTVEEGLDDLAAAGVLTSFRTTALNNITNSDEILLLDTTSVNVYDIPAPTAGKVFEIKLITVGAATLDAFTVGGAAIDGQNTYVITSQYDSIILKSDGTNWWIW